MDNLATPLYCVNLSCQEANPPDKAFCHKCGTPMVKRYLRALGDWIKAYRPGEILSDRYQLLTDKLLLDTHPGLPPQVPDEIPTQLLPYLKLFPYRLHLPQLYTYLPSPEEALNLDVCLLEYGIVPLDSARNPLYYPDLLSELTQVWPQASPLRQLNWLWQMAKLWHPLEREGVVSSLLDPFLLRVNGTTVQLLELQADLHRYHSVKELGQLWSSWIEGASSVIAPFLQDLCRRLQTGKIPHPKQLIAYLEVAIAQCAEHDERRYHLITCTDKGPAREHNEDACYPPVGEFRQLPESPSPLVIVCDGIGGQEGGEIASQLAIDTLVAQIEPRTTAGAWQSHDIVHYLEHSIRLTNDRISDRNDQENRKDRQRMGTTVVLALAHAHEIYLAHVGDSRIYGITPNSCHQITIDDDLASREVRLGYLFYRDAIQYPNSGALVQALGMNNSASLHPTVQRWILDEDCLFLLCSDGLSDYDRVEQFWESEMVPLFSQAIDLSSLAERLIEIANRHNGHDNVTVALLYCQVQPKPDREPTPLLMAQIEAALSTSSSFDTTDETDQETPPALPQTELNFSPIPTEVPADAPQKRPLLLLAGLGLLVLGGLAYGFWQLTNRLAQQPTEPTQPSLTSSPVLSLKDGSLIQLQAPLSLQTNLNLTSPSPIPNKSGAEAIAVPADSILKVLQKSPDGTLLQFKVCQVSLPPSPKASPKKTLPPALEGQEGWLNLKALIPAKAIPYQPTEPQVGACQVQ